jgi:hypothetical protein
VNQDLVARSDVVAVQFNMRMALERCVSDDHCAWCVIRTGHGRPPGDA